MNWCNITIVDRAKKVRYENLEWKTAMRRVHLLLWRRVLGWFIPLLVSGAFLWAFYEQDGGVRRVRSRIGTNVYLDIQTTNPYYVTAKFITNYGETVSSVLVTQKLW